VNRPVSCFRALGRRLRAVGTYTPEIARVGQLQQLPQEPGQISRPNGEYRSAPPAKGLRVARSDRGEESTGNRPRHREPIRDRHGPSYLGLDCRHASSFAPIQSNASSHRVKPLSLTRRARSRDTAHRVERAAVRFRPAAPPSGATISARAWSNPQCLRNFPSTRRWPPPPFRPSPRGPTGMSKIVPDLRVDRCPDRSPAQHRARARSVRPRGVVSRVREVILTGHRHLRPCRQGAGSNRSAVTAPGAAYSLRPDVRRLSPLRWLE